MTMKPILSLMVCLAAGGCATVATMKGDQSAQVQGRTLAYSLSGTGSPTVIFEAGMGDTKEIWAAVAPQVAKSTAVLTYDRAGYGASRVAFDRRSAIEVVADLRGLLEAAGLKPPYVLVGHSLGGLYMQYFARQYPGEVVGLVLVESTHWDQQARMEKESPATAAMTTVLVRSMPSHVRSEYEGSELTGQQVRNSPLPTGIPIVVLTGTHRNLLERGKFADVDYALQREIVNTYHAQQIIANRSGHYVQKDQPDLVVGAVADVLAQVREHAFRQPPN